MTDIRTNPMQQPGDADQAMELAALYAAGALGELESLDFESRVLAGDPACVEALAAVRPVMEALAATTQEVAPPAEARRVLEARLDMWVGGAAPEAGPRDGAHEHDHHHHDDDHDDTAAEPLVIVRKEQIKWRPTGLPGVRGRTLYADRKNNRRTLLLNMSPGSYIPDHAHGGVEEVIVLEGDLSIGDVPLKAGDYFRTQPGTRHGTPRTTDGCIALVFSSYSSITTRTKIGFAMDVLRNLLRGGKKAS